MAKTDGIFASKFTVYAGLQILAYSPMIMILWSKWMRLFDLIKPDFQFVHIAVKPLLVMAILFPHSDVSLDKIAHLSLSL